MLKKTHALALTVATAGLFGIGAPMASAATFVHHPASDLNISNNQMPLAVCGNDAATNAPTGIQTLAEGDALVGSLGSPGAISKATAIDHRGCGIGNKESNRNSDSTDSVVNIAGNQMPTAFCGNNLQSNGAGGTQTSVEGLAGALALLSPDAITHSTSVVDRGCGIANEESNSNKKQHEKKHCKPRGRH